MKILKRILIGIVIGIAIIILVGRLFSMIDLFSLLFGGQKYPEIKYGEFPFIVEFEMNGETYIIEDTVVCEFSGFDGMFQNMRTWSEHLKSGDEDKCTIIIEENKPSDIKNGRHNEWAKLRVFYGFGQYYMGEPSAKSLNYKYPQFIYYETYTENGENRYNWGTKLTEEDLKKYFGITVKRFEFSKPIKNKFK